eukprot:SAG31_NODE_10591_length_1120_cov_1.435847_3_plen_103_part_01
MSFHFFGQAARQLQEQSHQTALDIANVLLNDAIEYGDEQRWSLAFHYAEHVSKLTLTLQQCTQLLEHATEALNIYDELGQKRDSSENGDVISWFRFQDLQAPT